LRDWARASLAASSVLQSSVILKTLSKDFGTSRDADLLPPVPLPVPPVKLPVSVPVFSLPDRLVANGPLPVSALPAEPVRLAFAGK
jgi:hypothetical protein